MKYIPNVLSRTIAKQVVLADKHSPALLFGAGVVGIVGTAVLTAKATLKLDEVLEENAKAKLTAQELVNHQTLSYTEDDYRKDMVLIQIRSIVSVGRLYAPAMGVGLLTVAAFSKSHNILNKRNAVLAASYKALEKTFDDYRDRVAAKYGRDEEREIYMDAHEEVVEIDGKNKKVKVPGKNASSLYAKYFDKDNRNWNPTPEYNFLFLMGVQNHMNDMLYARGHVFLNDVYDALGMDRTTPGSVVGWVHGEGDNFIDFGIFKDTNTLEVYDFVRGENGIWLDFNVDGSIYEKISTIPRLRRRS